jgi:lipopolysaccharide biosynthesis glycosyltransferase
VQWLADSLDAQRLHHCLRKEITRMLLACSVDRSYVELAGIMFKSASLYGNINDVEFCVLADRLDDTDKANILDAAGRSVTFIDMTDEMVRKVRLLKTTSFWSRAIYGRLLVPELVGKTHDRIVYLDGDIVVQRDIRHLFTLDLKDNLIAAVSAYGSEKYNRKLGRDEGDFYFNSGVLVIDTKRWLDEGLTCKALELLNKNDFACMDQDVLNVLTEGRVCELDWIWNAQKVASFEDAAVIHFIHAKPDSTECRHPGADLYLSLRSGTAWEHLPLKTKRSRRARRVRHSISSRWYKLIAKFS